MVVAETPDTLRPEIAGVEVALSMKVEVAAPLPKVLPVSSTSSVAPCRVAQVSDEGRVAAIAAELPMTLCADWSVRAAWLRLIKLNPCLQGGPPIELAGMAMPLVSKSSPVTV